MAGSPQLSPDSIVPITAGMVFPDFYGGIEGMYVVDGTTLQAPSAIWRLTFSLPNPLPTGTGRFEAWALANATSGDAKYNITWGQANTGDDPDAVTKTGEGTQTITWGAGDANKYKQLLTVLDANTLTAGRQVILDIVHEDTGWTLAVKSGLFKPVIHWS